MDSLEARVAAVFRTVITGDRDQIEQAINNYTDPNGNHSYNLQQKKDSDGRNLLHYVCMYNTDEVATWMLSLRDYTCSRSPIPKISDKFGAAAVMYAAGTGKVTFVQEWIKQGNIINTVDEQGRNILHYCCGGGAPIPKLSDMTENLKTRKESLKQMSDFLIDNGIITMARTKQVWLPFSI